MEDFEPFELVTGLGFPEPLSKILVEQNEREEEAAGRVQRASAESKAALQTLENQEIEFERATSAQRTWVASREEAFNRNVEAQSQLTLRGRARSGQAERSWHSRAPLPGVETLYSSVGGMPDDTNTEACLTITDPLPTKVTFCDPEGLLSKPDSDTDTGTGTDTDSGSDTDSDSDSDSVRKGLALDEIENFQNLVRRDPECEAKIADPRDQTPFTLGVSILGPKKPYGATAASSAEDSFLRWKLGHFENGYRRAACDDSMLVTFDLSTPGKYSAALLTGSATERYIREPMRGQIEASMSRALNFKIGSGRVGPNEAVKNAFTVFEEIYLQDLKLPRQMTQVFVLLAISVSVSIFYFLIGRLVWKQMMAATRKPKRTRKIEEYLAAEQRVLPAARPVEDAALPEAAVAESPAEGTGEQRGLTRPEAAPPQLSPLPAGGLQTARESPAEVQMFSPREL